MNIKNMRVLVLLIASVIVFGCNSEKKSQNAYTIKATIEGAVKGDTVVLRKSDFTAQTDTFIVQEANTVFFEGAVVEPTAATIYFPATVMQTQSAITIFLEAGTIEVKGTKNKLQHSTIKGGAANADLQKVQTITNKYGDEMKKIGDELKALYDAGKNEDLKALEQQYLKLEENARNEIEAFIQKTPKSYVAAYFAYELFGYVKEEQKIASIYNNFDASIQQSKYGKKLKNVLDALQSTKVGKLAPNFTLNSIDDKPISLSSFKGKYVLIDFWASWCGPCRMENPNVVAAYNTYKNKNFTVLGVSLDEDKQKWVEAIAKDKLAWPHVSDLKGWSSTAANLYSVQSIPANFLIDPQGKIIAKDLRGEQLATELGKILK